MRQAFYRDSTIIGFGIRVASGGAKSYILERRIRGKVKRITLGRCQQMSFDKAQHRARQLIGQIERENAPRIRNAKVTDQYITLQQAYTEYLTAHPSLRPATLADYRRSLQGPLKDWRTTPITALTEERVLLRHESYADKDRARCNNAMRLLRAILAHAKLHFISAQHKPIITNNPVDILNRRGLWYPRQKKTRPAWIESRNLHRWWQATLQMRKASTRDYLQLLLLTGLSHTIVSTLRVENMDFENSLVRLNTKITDQTPLKLPIPPYLSKQLQARLSIQAHTGDYLFTGLNREKPLRDPRMAVKRVRKLANLDFSLNDLPRTFIHIAGMSVNHQPIAALLIAINRQRQVILTDTEIESMRQVQERIYSSCQGFDRK